MLKLNYTGTEKKTDLKSLNGLRNENAFTVIMIPSMCLVIFSQKIPEWIGCEGDYDCLLLSRAMGHRMFPLSVFLLSISLMTPIQKTFPHFPISL